LLETIPVHECAQYTPFTPTSYYHSLISLTTPFYPFSPPPSPPLVLKYKKEKELASHLLHVGYSAHVERRQTL